MSKTERRRIIEHVRRCCVSRACGPCECEWWALRRNAAWRARKRWRREHRA